MPTSDYQQISHVLHLVDQVAPRTVLDIGVGFGKWGVLCRELLEVGHRQQIDPAKWETRVDGVEIFEKYRTPLWDFAYDDIHIGDAAAFLARPGGTPYDLILCCDVIEHLEKEAGKKLLECMLANARVVILTSPKGFLAQGTAFGNDHEEHLSGWDESDFASLPHVYLEWVHTFIAAISRDPAAVAKLRFVKPLEVLGFKKGAKALTSLFGERFARKIRATFVR